MNEFPDIYFLPIWGNVYAEHDPGVVDRFFLNVPEGRVYYQFMKRPIPDELSYPGYYDTVTPYGFNGPLILECDPAAKTTLVQMYDQAFQEYCEQKKIIAEYIRFNPWLENHRDFSETYSLNYNNYTLYTDLEVEDFFMQEFSSKIRNLIRKAIRMGVEVEFDSSGDQLPEFQRLYQMMTEKNPVSDYYQFDTTFLQNTFKMLKGKQFMLNARYQNQIISSAIFLHHGNYLHYHLSANDPAYYSLNANSLILCRAAEWGKRNGKKQFHLGGAFSDSLFAFKQQFTKRGKCDYYVGKKIRNRELYDELVNARGKSENPPNSGYFPLYRG